MEGSLVFLVAKETLMFDRPSFDPRYSHGQQAGGSIRPHSTTNGIPAMFLPNYSGDGQGRTHTSVTRPGNSMPDSRESLPIDGEMPVWSGDGRRNVVNPLMPVYQADGRPSFGQNQGSSRPAGRTQPPQVLPASGDGRSGNGSVELSTELSMTVNPPAVAPSKPAKERRAKARKAKAPKTVRQTAGNESRAERSEMWKLVALVVIFLIWISTASTLLFLYMDRYLFP